MVRGEELGLAPIKCQNKEGTEELKKIHYDINDVFYNFKKKYISPRAGNEIYQQLVEIGKALAALNVPAKAQAKKDELLTRLRATVLTLKNYIRSYTFQPGDLQQIQAMINWEVKRLVDAKKSLDLENEPIKYLEEIHFLDRNYINPHMHDLQPFKLYEFNTEILNIIAGKYSITPSL